MLPAFPSNPKIIQTEDVSEHIISVIKSRRMGWACSTRGRRDKCILSDGKPEGKRLLERRRCRWKDNITVDDT
jgi:hypothetical protein